jgi:hypothetical protein
MQVGETKTYTIKGIDYEVRLLSMITPTDGRYSVQYSVNGEMSEQSYEGQTLTTTGAKITSNYLLSNGRGKTLAVFTIEATPTNPCYDSDGGQNFYLQGTTTGLMRSSPEDIMTTSTDICCSPGMGCHPIFTSDDLYEYFCQDNYLNINVTHCDNGCKDGACIQDTTTQEVRVSSPKQGTAYSEMGVLMNISCSIYDSDIHGMLVGKKAENSFSVTWPAEIYHGTYQYPWYFPLGDNYTLNITCVKGTAIASKSIQFGAYCTTDASCGQGQTCKNGTCINNPTCTDSDNGPNINTKGHTQKFNADGTGSWFDDVCATPENGVNYPAVYEGYCKGNEVTNELMKCPENTVCNDGACINTTLNQTNDTTTKCFDTDGGKNFYVSGYTIQEGVTKYYDQCINGQLRELYCSDFAGGVSSEIFYNCATENKVCQNGACINITLNQTNTKKPVCGNGKVESGEVCDGGKADCGEFGFVAGYSAACKKDCSGYDTSYCLQKPVCGNGVCEDKVGETSTNCMQDCAPIPYCGDKICNNGETYSTCKSDCKPECIANSDCKATDECMTGVCNQGICLSTNLPDNTRCSVGICQRGTCETVCPSGREYVNGKCVVSGCEGLGKWFRYSCW